MEDLCYRLLLRLQAFHLPDVVIDHHLLRLNDEALYLDLLAHLLEEVMYLIAIIQQILLEHDLEEVLTRLPLLVHLLHELRGFLVVIRCQVGPLLHFDMLLLQFLLFLQIIVVLESSGVIAGFVDQVAGDVLVAIGVVFRGALVLAPSLRPLCLVERFRLQLVLRCAHE